MIEQVKPKMVKIILEKHGMSIGNHGDTVEVPEAVAKHMTAYREVFDGSKHIPYRTARMADEKVVEVPVAAATQGEMNAMGKKNIVETPKDDILPERMRNMDAAAEAESEESEDAENGAFKKSDKKKKA